MTNQDLRHLLNQLSAKPNPVLSELELLAFEAKHGVALPSGYRSFLMEVGNGVEGLAGLFQLGCWHDEALPDSILARVAEEFDGDEAEACYEVEESLPGLLPIADAGCSSCFSLVVNGEAAGQVWYDNRVDGSYLEPVVDDEGPVMFRAWYAAALAVRV